MRTKTAVPAVGLVAALVLAGAARSATPPVADTPTNTAPSGLQQRIVAKEAEGLEALKSGDLAHFGNLTAEDAILIDDHGPAGKAQVLKNVANFHLLDFAMDDVQFVALGASAGLITYRLTSKGESHGKEFTAQAYVSSIWTEREGVWVCVFSQETLKKK